MTHDQSRGGAASGPGEPPAASGSTASSESTTRRILHLAGQAVVLPLVGLIRVYQLVISPLTPPSCRYYPSCSAYAVTALRRFGPIKGTWLAARRLLRCHPWAPGGVDHVPERTHTEHTHTEPTHTERTQTASADLPARMPDRAGQPEALGPVGPTGPDPHDPPSTTPRSAERPTDPRDKGLS